MQKETNNTPTLETKGKEQEEETARLPENSQHTTTTKHQSLYSYKLLSSIWKWTGFGDKTLWDFLQLLVVPVALIISGVAIQEFVKGASSG